MGLKPLPAQRSVLLTQAHRDYLFILRKQISNIILRITGENMWNLEAED
jgi:hypothetical protein